MKEKINCISCHYATDHCFFHFHKMSEKCPCINCLVKPMCRIVCYNRSLAYDNHIKIKSKEEVSRWNQMMPPIIQEDIELG